jgi:hypothetical protein
MAIAQKNARELKEILAAKLGAGDFPNHSPHDEGTPWRIGLYRSSHLDAASQRRSRLLLWFQDSRSACSGPACSRLKSSPCHAFKGREITGPAASDRRKGTF